MLRGVEARMPRRFVTLHASAVTGQILPPNASWCTKAPFVPFLVLAIKMVALSALRRVGSPDSWTRSWPLCQRRTLHFHSGMVRLGWRLHEAVYLRTLRRYNNATITKSATDAWCGLEVYFVIIARMVDTGMANFGCGGRSSSLNFFNSRAIGKLSECWAGDTGRGSQCPSRTYFWATAWSATSTD